jgi:hypothetical protein
MKRLIGMVVAGMVATSVLALGGTAAAARPATVNVVHGVPGAKVDVCVNGDEVKSGFVYTQKFAAELPAGEYKLAIKLAEPGNCDGALVRTKNVELKGGKNYTVIAGLTKKGSPKLFAFMNKMGDLAKGEARVQVRHTAAAPAVDVWVNDAPAITKFKPGAEATVVLPKGDYRVAVAPAGTTTVVIGPRMFELSGGMAYQVFAVGSGDAGYRFLVVAQEV